MSTNIYLRTFGCSVNFSEGEAMKGLLREAGFNVVKKAEDAFIIILNICTVKGTASALRRIRQAREMDPYKKLIIAGCISDDIIKPIKKIDPDVSFVNTNNLKNIVSVVEETLHDNPVSVMEKPEENPVKINLPKIRKNKIIAIVPICSGCNGHCAYCSVRLIKGKLFSYPMENVIEEIETAVRRDKCKEIWVTSQDNACYMLDKHKVSKLPQLLHKIASIPGDFRVRVGMMNPNNVYPILDDLIEAFRQEKIFKFLHLPVQSGSPPVLKAMNRRYSVTRFREIVDRFRKEIPELTIATDIICGFPGETKEQFRESLTLIDDIKPDVLNISRFRPRPGTKAAEMEEQVDAEEAKNRSRLLNSQFEWTAFRQNKKWVGWKGSILIDENGKENSLIGRNDSYKQVIIHDPRFSVGDRIKVHVLKNTKYDLRAEVIEDFHYS